MCFEKEDFGLLLLPFVFSAGNKLPFTYFVSRYSFLSRAFKTADFSTSLFEVFFAYAAVNPFSPQLKTTIL